MQAMTKDWSSNVNAEIFEDNYADVDVGEHRPGYVKSDRKDMYRMGKRQELMVSMARHHTRTVAQTV